MTKNKDIKLRTKANPSKATMPELSSILSSFLLLSLFSFICLQKELAFVLHLLVDVILSPRPEESIFRNNPNNEENIKIPKFIDIILLYLGLHF